MSDVWTNNAQKALLSQAARNILENNFGCKIPGSVECVLILETWVLFCIRDISRLSFVDALWSNNLKFNFFLCNGTFRLTVSCTVQSYSHEETKQDCMISYQICEKIMVKAFWDGQRTSPSSFKEKEQEPVLEILGVFFAHLWWSMIRWLSTLNLEL